jgi:hypothetical protein
MPHIFAILLADITESPPSVLLLAANVSFIIVLESLLLAGALYNAHGFLKSSEKACIADPEQAASRGRIFSLVGFVLSLIGVILLYIAGHSLIDVFQVLNAVAGGGPLRAELQSTHSSLYIMNVAAVLFSLAVFFWLLGATRLARVSQASWAWKSLVITGGLALTAGGGLIAYSGLQATSGIHSFGVADWPSVADLAQLISNGSPAFLWGTTFLASGTLLLLIYVARGVRHQPGQPSVSGRLPCHGWLFAGLALAFFAAAHCALHSYFAATEGRRAIGLILDSNVSIKPGVLGGIIVRFTLAWLFIGIAFIAWGIGQLLTFLPLGIDGGAEVAQSDDAEAGSSAPDDS